MTHKLSVTGNFILYRKKEPVYKRRASDTSG